MPSIPKGSAKLGNGAKGMPIAGIGHPRPGKAPGTPKERPHIAKGAEAAGVIIPENQGSIGT